MSPPLTEKEMSKYDGLVPLLEYINTFKKRPTESSSERPRKSPDAVELLHKKLREKEALETFLKDYEKAHKKEEKKAEGLLSKLTTTQLTIFMVVTVPVYLVLLMKLLK